MRRFRFAYLLVSLVLVVFLRPFIAEQVFGVAFVDILLLFALIAGVFTAIERRQQFVVIAVLAVGSAGSQIAWWMTGSHSLLVAFLASTLLFNAYVTWFLIRSIHLHQSLNKAQHSHLNVNGHQDE